jgi:7-cyano-7-deazaguanine synthase in queuosine biosynthesis
MANIESFIKCRYESHDNKEDKKHIVLWSGGCDSTLLLYELLDAYGAENVIAISYNYPWLDSIKAELENDHREIFKRKMKLMGLRYANFKHHVVEINMPEDSIDVQTCSGLPQALGWLFMIPMYANENSYIYAAYVKDDDFLTEGYKYHYKNIFKSVNKLIGRENLILRLPYVKRSKIEIIENLIKNDIYDDTWYCEMPMTNHMVCMECHPCQTHMAALTYLSLFSKDSYVKTIALRKIEYLQSLYAKKQDKSSLEDNILKVN